MAHSGRNFELFIKRMQEYFADKQIDVRSPERFYDNEGTLKGEIDVTLRGDFGSSSIFVGIECRDRPQERQGVDWIWQIVGKKASLKVDRMIAVSTGGYTDQAVDVANQHGIEILEFRAPEALSVAEWFPVIDFSWNVSEWKVAGVIDVRGTNSGRAQELLRLGSLMDKHFRRPQGEERYSLQDLVEPRIKEMMKDYGPHPVAREVESTIILAGPFCADLDGSSVVIDSMRVPIKLSSQPETARFVLNECRRLSDDTVIAYAGVIRLSSKGGPAKVEIIVRKSRDDPTKYDSRLNFLDENDGPFPVTGEIQLWAKKRDAQVEAP